jgi:hypothetical protein
MVVDSIRDAVPLANVESGQVVFLNEPPKKINAWALKGLV